MKLKPKSEWRVNRSVTRGRSSGGQIIYKDQDDITGEDRFLIRGRIKGFSTTTE